MVEKVEIGRATLYLGDCNELVAQLAAAEILLSDPPYGIGYKVNAHDWSGEKLTASNRVYGAAKPMIHGDDKAFDPAPWLTVPKIALFGANHFAHRLPPGGRWVIWDKRCEMKPDDHSDCELVWTNQKGVQRIHRQKWRGVVREGEENCSRSKKLHPNQKPVALLGFILEQLGAAIGSLVADPFMGSGSTGVAALRRGAHFVGCEIEPAYFQIARDRLAAEQQ